MAEAKIVVGDCLETLREMPEGIFHTCVTSPPYWGLRDYKRKGQHGLERSPDEYVETLVRTFREVRRVLRNDGTLWLNLGDTYASDHGGYGYSNGAEGIGSKTAAATVRRGRVEGYKPKDLIGIPWMVAFALRRDGWYLRSDIVWHKPNAMPESVTDRPTTSHEYLFLLSKSEHYFYDHVAIREDAAPETAARYAYDFGGGKSEQLAGEGFGRTRPIGERFNDGKRNKRTVWNVNNRPFNEAHFATFPPELVEPCILAGTSRAGCCRECGAPYEREIESVRSPKSTSHRDDTHWNAGQDLHPHRGYKGLVEYKTVAWNPTCSHEPTPTLARPVVLDPYGGSGTTAAVALAKGCDAVLCELNDEYARLAHRRIHNDAPMFNSVTAG